MLLPHLEKVLRSAEELQHDEPTAVTKVRDGIAPIIDEKGEKKKRKNKYITQLVGFPFFKDIVSFEKNKILLVNTFFVYCLILFLFDILRI